MTVLAALAVPPEYAGRRAIADEVHARPYEALDTPLRASCIAVLVSPEERERERAHLAALCTREAVLLPQRDMIQFSASFDGYRLRWERHNEFSSYTVYAPPAPDATSALEAVPADWRAAIPGRIIAASHAEVLAEAPPMAETGAAVGAQVAGGAAMAFTDFRLDAHGFVRFTLVDLGLTPRQAGRTLQRLFEIENYRVLALLALPEARRVSAQMPGIERALQTLTGAIARGSQDDEALLGELTALAAEVESAIASTQYRFGAGRAYYDLVRARIGELREARVPGLQTVDEFMQRRLAPAMATCESASRRLRELSERVARASSLLSTRVDIARERQNQALLASMDRRAGLQVRLQQAVEGLSVAAITYYIVGLVDYAAKGLSATGLDFNPAAASALAIPAAALLIYIAVRRLRRRITRDRP